jgi:hypothetical protein
MSYQQLDEEGKTFLLELYRESHGDVSQQLSMYAIGEQMGLERATTSKLVESLIGWELVEIRTLSGGVGITVGAVEELEALGFGEPSEGADTPSLGSGPVLEAEAREALETLVADLKQQTGSLQLPFDGLSEWMADLKTVDAQLESPHPKTGILRACLESLREPVARADLPSLSRRIQAMLAE